MLNQLRLMFIGLLFLAATAVQAEVKPASVFTDHAVLQRGKPIPIWGTADPGEWVTVRLAGNEAAPVAADPQGNWRAILPAMEAGGPHELTVIAGNTVTISDVLIGDVWICSGQSNMEWPLRATRNGEEEVKAANYPQIRLLLVPNVANAEAPQTQLEARWQVCTPDTARGFSAVGYFFGRHLHHELEVPIGLIDSAWGGTQAEAWTPRSTLDASEVTRPFVQRYEKALAVHDEAMKKYQEALKAWEEQNKDKPRNQRSNRPRAPMGPTNPHAPAALYNGMIHPLVPYAITGAIWYQGESNVDRAEAYYTVLPRLIQGWREAFGQGDFPFLIVQLANYTEPATQPVQAGGWPEVRDAQLYTARTVPNTGLAVTIDIGEAKDIHPRNKQDVGRRLALLAEKIAYGREVVCTGPTLKDIQINGNEVTLTFDAAKGLEARDPNQTGKPLPFALAGEDKQFHAATARIEGNRVILTSDAVANPVAVRYAWSNNPDSALLYNSADLPASPFRTDDWPLTTAGRR